MKLHSREPEYSVVSPEKIGPYLEISPDITHEWLALEVDLAVLSRELKLLEGFSIRIGESLHMLRVQLRDTE